MTLLFLVLTFSAVCDRSDSRGDYWYSVVLWYCVCCCGPGVVTLLLR